MSLNTYFNSLQDPISKVEEQTATVNQLVEANLKFVVKVAHQFKGRMCLDDIIQLGNIGLFKAAQKFNPSVDSKFITYAVHYIRAYIMRGIRNNSPISKDWGRDTKFVYLDADKFNFDIVSSREYGHHSNFCDFNKYNPAELFEYYEEKSIKSKHGLKLSKYLDKLPDDLKFILENHYGLSGIKKMTLDEIGRTMNKKPGSVFAMEKRAIRQLRKLMHIEIPDDENTVELVTV